jgi:hypothetical protein
MFSFENAPGIESISNVSEFLGHIPNIWDNDSSLVLYQKKDGCFSMASLQSQ